MLKWEKRFTLILLISGFLFSIGIGTSSAEEEEEETSYFWVIEATIKPDSIETYIFKQDGAH